MNFASVLDNKWTIPVVTGVVGVAGGFAAGYFIGRRNGDNFVIEEVTLNTDSSDEWDGQMELEEAEEAAAALETALMISEVSDIERGEEIVSQLLNDTPPKRVDYNLPVIPDEAASPIQHNAFATPPKLRPEDAVMGHSVGWDEGAEAEKRIPGEPYVIPVEAYYSNEYDFSQLQLTYYAGDDTLVDEHDVPIYNHKTLLGELKFGHGSGEAEVVYIRNENQSREWEVSRVDGHYSVEVLGNTIEEEYASADLKHSNDRKFRDD